MGLTRGQLMEVRHARHAFAAVALAAALASGCTGDAKTAAEVSAALQGTLSSKKRPGYVTADAEGARLWKVTREFYQARQYAPAWIDGTQPRREIEEFVKALWAAEQEGLDPELYSVKAIDARWREA
jgi:hypothetical protein